MAAIRQPEPEQKPKQQETILKPPQATTETDSYKEALDAKKKAEIIRTREKQRIADRKRLEEEKPKIMILGSKHLGSHIVLALKDVAKIVVIDKDDPAYIWLNPMVREQVRRSEISEYHFALYDLEVNLKSLIDIQKPDFIVNTIAVHGSLFSEGNPIGTYQINSLYTVTMMKAILQANSNAKILHMSTDKVYGDQGCPAGLNRIMQKEEDMVNKGKYREVEVDGYWSEFKISEDAIPNPLGNKAISRYVQEMTIQQMCKTYGIDYMIWRIGNMFGRHTPKDNLINSMIDAAETTGQINIFGDRYASRDLVDIEMVARLVKRVLIEDYDQSKWNEVYNIGGGASTRTYIHGLAFFIQVLYAGAGVKNLSPDSYAFLKDYGSVRIKQNPPRCFEDTQDACIRNWLEIKKAREALNWTQEDWYREWEISLKDNILYNQAYHHGKKMDEINEIRAKLEVNKQSQKLLEDMDRKLIESGKQTTD